MMEVKCGMITNLKDAAAAACHVLSRYPQIKKAWIFGSFAQASQTEDSDLDILVDFDLPMGFEFISMAEDLEDACGRRVDVLTLEQADQLEHRYGYEIVGKAEPVYARGA